MIDDQLIEQAIQPTFINKKAHVGMPPLEQRKQPASYFEFWPTLVIYFPVLILWLVNSIRYRSLTLPLSANPGFFLGGLVGEAKSGNFDQAGLYAKKYFARWFNVVNQKDSIPTVIESVEKEVSRHGFSYPFIAKPDVGCRGQGVNIIRNDRELNDYLNCFPDDAPLIIQELIPWEAEAGVFYIRYPGECQGKIFSLTLKYQPYVYGNGKDSLRQLIEKDERAGKLAHLYLKRHKRHLDLVLSPGQPFRLAFAGSHSKGAIFRDGRHLITDAMSKKFDSLAHDIDGFYYGRFDVRFFDEISFRQGESFRVLEINGISSEAAHIWDAGSTLKEVYRTLFTQYNTLFKLGAVNRSRGATKSSMLHILKAWQYERKLGKQYPFTE